MTKYFKTEHYTRKDNKMDIYFNSYITKSGNLKFVVEIYAALHNDSGFCTRIARYITADNAMQKYIRMHPEYYLKEVETND